MDKIKKVALLGDSIRMGYAPRVMGLLGEDYLVFSPNDNCRYAQYQLRMLFDFKEQLEECDIIHFNSGIWDTVDYFGDGIFNDEDTYLRTMVRIAKILQTYAPRVIFATTTPIRKECPDIDTADIIRFNERLVPLLEEMGVEINDLFSTVYADIESNVRGDDYTHLTDAGNELCARQVAAIIKKA